MASSGKKGKKNKGTVISLQSFLSSGEVSLGTTQVAKNIRNVDGEESDDGAKVLTVICQLPTAPRANRIFDDNSIPHKSPFIAYITNLPFDVKEDDIYEYFNANHVVSVRLPREDGDTGRVRGFGYVEFESRDDLIQSLSIPDPAIKGRRIRIDLSNENEQNVRQRGGRKAYESSSGHIEGKESVNWRRDNNQKRDSYNFGAERNVNRDQKSISDDNSPGSWRLKNCSGTTFSSSLEHLHRQQDVVTCQKDNTVERPKLVLKPRTLPIPELDVQSHDYLESKVNINNPKISGTSAEKVFGSAKPVDTTARDLEIEARLAGVRRQDNIRKEIIKTTNGLNELSFTKDEKLPSYDNNWRRQNINDETSKNQEKNGSRTDKPRDNIRDRKKYHDKIDSYDIQKNKEGKRKDILKSKREFKVDHKNTNIHNVIQSSNKYSGLDEISD